MYRRKGRGLKFCRGRQTRKSSRVLGESCERVSSDYSMADRVSFAVTHFQDTKGEISWLSLFSRNTGLRESSILLQGPHNSVMYKCITKVHLKPQTIIGAASLFHIKQTPKERNEPIYDFKGKIFKAISSLKQDPLSKPFGVPLQESLRSTGHLFSF